MAIQTEAGRIYDSGEGAVFIQLNGLNTAPDYLGCHDVDDIEETLGETAVWLCKDASAAGRWKTVKSSKGAPSKVTTTIMTDIRKKADLLEELPDDTPIYFNLQAGRQDIFTAFERSFGAKWTNESRTRSNLVKGREEEGGSSERGEQSFDLTAPPPLYAFFDLSDAALRVSVVETAAFNNIVFCDENCETGFATADNAGATTANVVDVETWAATADPFGTSEAIVGATCFPITKTGKRWLVARGTTDAGNPAEVAYSDDNGATWTLANVGSTNAQFAPDSGSLYALDQYHIWMTTSGGYIYFSDDGGATWTAQESGVIHTGNNNAVFFADEDTGMVVGAGDVISISTDGGETWSAATATGSAQALTTVGFSGDFWWVGTGGGRLYYTDDFGDSWTQRRFAGDNAGNVAMVKFLNEFFGVIAHNTAAPVGRLFYTINGGYDWKLIPLPTNAGINDLWICSHKKIYAVGEASGGTAVVVKVEV